MSPENAAQVWQAIRSAGDRLRGQLPEHPNHPQGRNPYAHVALCVKTKWGQSYRDIPDRDMDSVLTYIEWLVENPK